MADQEFLASFAVEIDEQGVSRLQAVLEENRKLAEELAAAFTAASEAIHTLAEDLGTLPGLPLWEAQVSLSVEAGVTVSETVNRILESSGTGIPLLSFPGKDPVMTRPQAFYGRAAECVDEALSAARARGYLTEAGLGIVPEEGGEEKPSGRMHSLSDGFAFVGWKITR